LKHLYSFDTPDGVELTIAIEDGAASIHIIEGLESAAVSLPMGEMRKLGALFSQYAREADYVSRHGKLT